MNLTYFLSKEEASQSVSKNLLNEIRKRDASKPASKFRISIATGLTVNILYDILINSQFKSKCSANNTEIFQLDEFYGLTRDELYMRHQTKSIADAMGIPETNQYYHKFTGDSKKDEDDYNNLIGQQYFDLMILGIGSNGHLAYNEPGTRLETRTSVVKLTNESMNNMYNYGFKESDPLINRGITIGLSDIFQSKSIILLIFGEHKREVLERLISCKNVNNNFPASILINHLNCSILTDIKLNNL